MLAAAAGSGHIDRRADRGRPYVLDERTAVLLLEATADPAPLLPSAAAIGEPMAVLPTLFHLLWTGRMACDLGRPLADHTMIWRDRR